MTKTAAYNQIGDKVTDIELNPKIFGIEKIDVSLVHTAVRAQQNNNRKSIAHTKMRGEVAGSGKKPWKQKGTGRARAGSVRSPLWRHGGITFGPRNVRNWGIKLNDSAFRKAVFTILTDKLNEKKLVIIDSLDNTAKTKELAAKLTVLADKSGLGKKYLLILDKSNKDLERSAGNLQNVKIIYADQINVLDLMKYDLMILKEALPIIEKTYLK
jgi:large subunit ribosomal protein L4